MGPRGLPAGPDPAALRQLFDSLTMGVVVQDAEGRIASANPAAARILGLPAADLTRRTSTDPEWRSLDASGVPMPGDQHPAMEALRTGRTVSNVVMGIYHPIGHEHRWIEVTAVPLFGEDRDRPLGVYTIFGDVTERRATERALHARIAQQEAVGRLQQMALSDTPLDDLFGAAVESVRATLNGRFAGVLQSLGGGRFTVRRVSGETAPVAPLEDAGGPRGFAGAALESDVPVIVQDWRTETRFDKPLRLDERRIRSSMSAPIRGADGRFGVIAVHSDAAGRFDAQAVNFLEAVAGVLGSAVQREAARGAQRRSEELFHAVIEGTSDAIFIKDLEGRYRLINSAGAAQVGRTPAEVIGLTDHDLFPPGFAVRFVEVDRQVVTTGRAETFDDGGNGPEPGRHFLISKMPHRNSEGEIIGVIGIARDITELRALEEQLRQVQKMDAIGRLAGGIAHDFNNLLTVILGYAEVLEEPEIAPEESRESVAEIRKAAERAALLTRQLLAFSRRQILQPRIVDVNSIVANTDRMLRRIVGEDITFRTVLAAEPSQVKVDPGQIEQVLLNLVVNAREAMPNGGTLTIETAAVTFDRDELRRHPGVIPGDYVLLAVSDTGVGMDRETLARAFEPFFTTKGIQSTGLGLSTVYGVVKQSGGEVWARSEPARGTSVEVFLPRVHAPAVEPPARGTFAARGAERVLIVEDERAVRGLLTAALGRLGYEVFEAEDGEQALSILRQQDRPLDLLLTDIVMPGINGRDLAQAVLARLPGVKVLFISGYADHAALSAGPLAAGQHFLQKPFTAAALAAKVRSVLDG